MNDKKYYLGIDGGGTKTEFVLTDEQGNVLKRYLDKGSNPNDIGIENCVDVLHSGIEHVLGNLPSGTVCIFAGISGAGVGENAKRIQESLQNTYPWIRVDSDLVNALETSLQGEDGIAVICGTGISCSICKDGARKTIGGYGYLFEDGGSGYAYGRDGVKAVLRLEDGIGESTCLSEYFYETLGKSVKSALKDILLGGKSAVASFCPLVFKGYENGDKVCAEIIENNLLYTTTLIKDALSVSEMANPKIAFVGGVTKETVFREKMQTEFGKEHTLAFSTNKPIYGAVRKAVTLFGGTIHENFENNFEKTIKGM